MSESNTVSLRAGDQVKLVSHPGQKVTVTEVTREYVSFSYPGGTGSVKVEHLPKVLKEVSNG